MITTIKPENEWPLTVYREDSTDNKVVLITGVMSQDLLTSLARKATNVGNVNWTWDSNSHTMIYQDSPGGRTAWLYIAPGWSNRPFALNVCQWSELGERFISLFKEYNDVPEPMTAADTEEE